MTTRPEQAGPVKDRKGQTVLINTFMDPKGDTR
jgi:hypothetical protein